MEILSLFEWGYYTPKKHKKPVKNALTGIFIRFLTKSDRIFWLTGCLSLYILAPL